MYPPILYILVTLVANFNFILSEPFCSKPNTEFKNICKVQPSCDQPDPEAGRPTKCMEGCFCKEGFVLNPIGDCILTSQCPQCPGNQTYSHCAGCGKSCKTQFVIEQIADRCKCKPGCACSEGFIYDSNRNCIRPDECDPETVVCPSEVMVYSNCQSNVETCDGPIFYKRCPSGCFCPEGMVFKDGNMNECVTKKDCPNPVCNKPNQTLEECSKCRRSCGNYWINIMFKCPCQLGCACEEGYIWSDNSEQECVKPEDCTEEDTRCQETQHFSHSEVPKTCLKPTNPNGVNASGCFCNGDLVYDEDSRTCMKASECPNAQCQARQSYQECNTNMVRTCRNKEVARVRDVEMMECKNGCFCNDPYIWDEETYSCVQEPECQNSKENKVCKQEDPRSEFRVCQSSVRPTCKDPNPTKLTKDCRSECRCKQGYVFNEEKKTCMTLEECAQMVGTESSRSTTCDSNSTYSACASACPPICANAYINPGTAMAMCMACYEGCQCKSGFLKTKDQRCVLIKDCPAEEINCPFDRQYKPCEHDIKSCSGVISHNDTCLRGCFCGQGMVQDPTGRCIYPGECKNSTENQKCEKNDINSHYKECQLSRRTCSDPQGLKVKDNCMNGCFCNIGFVYYKKYDRCVAEDTCSL